MGLLWSYAEKRGIEDFARFGDAKVTLRVTSRREGDGLVYQVRRQETSLNVIPPKYYPLLATERISKDTADRAVFSVVPPRYAHLLKGEP